MNRLYGILPWILIVLGAVHMAATWRFYHDLTSASLWFFNGGIVLVFGGVLNLINRRHGAQVPAIRRFCLAVNVVLLLFAAVSGIVDGAGWASLTFVLGTMGAITILSGLAVKSPRAPAPER